MSKNYSDYLSQIYKKICILKINLDICLIIQSYKVNTFFKALNDPTRREILELLNKGDLTAGEIAARFNMTKPSISHHLDLLKQAGLVICVREGQFQKYSISTTVFDEIVKWMLHFK